MKKLFTILLFTATLIGAPVIAADSIRCTTPTQECLDKMVANLSKTGWLGVLVDEHREDGTMYMEITEVFPGSPAEKSDFRKGDVLVAINGIPLLERNKEEIYRTNKKRKRPGEYFTYTVLRNGERIRKSVTLATIPYETIARIVGEHMLEHSHTDISKLLAKDQRRKGKKK